MMQKKYAKHIKESLIYGFKALDYRLFKAMVNEGFYDQYRSKVIKLYSGV